MQRQAELGKSLSPFNESPQRFGPSLETQHQITRVTNDDYIAVGVLSPPGCPYPCQRFANGLAVAHA